MTPPDAAAMTADMFPVRFKAKMIWAYPVIAGMDHDFFAWHATTEEKEAAFGRILAARNLQRTCSLYLEGKR